MTTKNIIIATYQSHPQGSENLQSIAEYFNQQGHQTEITPWQNIDPSTTTEKNILPLAVWDYSDTPQAYLDWLKRLESHGAIIHNSPSIQQWNINKRYLLELANQCPAVMSGKVLDNTVDDWQSILQAYVDDDSNPVIKPLIGQSGKSVCRLNNFITEFQRLPTVVDYPHGIMIQDYVSASFGEVCLVYFNGDFSHAFHRQTPKDEWRNNSAYGAVVSPIEVKEEWLIIGKQVLNLLPEMPTYARVDGLILDNETPEKEFCVNEVELIEPGLMIPENRFSKLLESICV